MENQNQKPFSKSGLPVTTHKQFALLYAIFVTLFFGLWRLFFCLILKHTTKDFILTEPNKLLFSSLIFGLFSTIIFMSFVFFLFRRFNKY